MSEQQVKGASSSSGRPTAGEDADDRRVTPPRPPEQRRPDWLASVVAGFRERFAASQQAITLVAPATAVAVAAILIVPAVVGFAAQAYIGDIHHHLATTEIAGAPDLATALSWGTGSDPALLVGTASGRVLQFSRHGVTEVHPPMGGPVLAVEARPDDVPVAAIADGSQLSDTPTGPLGATAGFGAETCLSGFVWREATESDLVCVTPDSRARALEARAEAEANPVATCAGELIKRQANAADEACVTSEIAQETAVENRLDQSRKIVPDAGRQGSVRLDVLPLANDVLTAERGLFALVGDMIIAGERRPGVEATSQQAVAPPSAETTGLGQWTVVDGTLTQISPVGGIEDARVIARQPGSSTVFAGDGAGGIFAIDASQQMSGVNPEVYLRQLGTHDAAITAIAVASAPAPGLPSLATAAEDGTIRIWWPEQSAPSRALEPPALSAEIAMSGSIWALASTSVRSTRVLLGNEGGQTLVTDIGDALALFKVRSDFDITAPGVAAGLDGMTLLSVSRDGRRSAGYDPASGSMVVYDGVFGPQNRRVPVGKGTPRRAELSPSGDALAIVESDGTVEIVSIDSGTTLTLTAPTSANYAVFDPSGLQLALGLDDGSVALMRVGDGTLLRLIDASSGREGFTPRRWAVQVRYAESGRQLVFYDPIAGEQSTYSIRLQRQSEWRATSADAVIEGVLSADARRLVTRFADGRIAVLDVRTGFELGSVEAPGVTAWGMSGDAGVIAVRRQTGELDIYAEQEDPSVPGPTPQLARDGLRLSADGSTLLTRDPGGSLHAWDVSDPNAVHMLPDPAPGLVATAAELAPDGRFVVAADQRGAVHLIDLADRVGATIVQHGSIIHLMSLSADGRLLASASIDGIVRLTDMGRARLVGAWPLVATPLGQLSPPPAMRTLPDQAFCGLPTVSCTPTAPVPPNGPAAAEPQVGLPQATAN